MRGYVSATAQLSACISCWWRQSKKLAWPQTTTTLQHSNTATQRALDKSRLKLFVPSLHAHFKGVRRNLIIVRRAPMCRGVASRRVWRCSRHAGRKKKQRERGIPLHAEGVIPLQVLSSLIVSLHVAYNDTEFHKITYVFTKTHIAG